MNPLYGEILDIVNRLSAGYVVRFDITIREGVSIAFAVMGTRAGTSETGCHWTSTGLHILETDDIEASEGMLMGLCGAAVQHGMVYQRSLTGVSFEGALCIHAMLTFVMGIYTGCVIEGHPASYVFDDSTG